MYKKALILIFLATIILFFNTICIAQPAIKDNSINGRLTELEQRVYLRNFDGQPSIERLMKLENDVMGQQQKGSIFERLNNISKIIYSRKPGSIITNNSNNTSNNSTQSNANAAPDNNTNTNGINLNNQQQSKQIESITQYTQNYPPPREEVTYQEDIYTPSNNTKDIPGLNSRFEEGIKSSDNIPTREEIKKMREQEKLESLKTETENSDNKEDKKQNKNKKKKKKSTDEQEQPEFDPNSASYYDTVNVCQ